MNTHSRVATAHGTELAGRVRRRPDRPRSPPCSIERLEALHAELARRAGDAGRLRFEMGRGLDLLERLGGDHALGFSSIEAYALERCERSASWTQKARGLARRLEALPAVAEALISGSLNWSLAAVVASVARPDGADFWLAEASRRTVREMKALALERQGTDETEVLEAADVAMRTLTLTVPREDAWCFEQAKLLARHLGDGSTAEVVFGLVAESTSTLCSELPSTAIELPDDDATDRQRAWERELARMRAESEVRCEPRFRHRRNDEPLPTVARIQWPAQPEAIDQQLRELSRELVSREVAYGRALETFFSADGWRRLGYATAAQYARERLGTSLSSIKAKRHLVKRLGKLRFLADALDRGELGYEAARLVAGVASGETVQAWVDRARERTLRHLREEIDSAELLARWSESSTVVPPSDAGVRRVEELERAVVTGQISATGSRFGFRCLSSLATLASPKADRAGLAGFSSALAARADRDLLVPRRLGLGRADDSPATTPPANITLRLRVHACTARDYRHWEAIYLRHRGTTLRNTTFLRFASMLFTDTWRPRASEVEYAHIYERDLHRCQSPCCGRRDVTPHHLRFRSQGGDDSDENVTSLCTWCHLQGIHGGQISATPPASNIRWTFGCSKHTVVEGRRRLLSS